MRMALNAQIEVTQARGHWFRLRWFLLSVLFLGSMTFLLGTIRSLRPAPEKPSTGQSQSTLLNETSDEFRPVTVVRPFPPIVDAKTLKADEVTTEVQEGELVIGVVVGDEARAYPINMLTGPKREIINDVLGGQAIAATW